jgi:prevent-host-death family protein
MQFVNIHDAKTNLSKYLEQVHFSHEPIIICKNGNPIAQLTEYHPPSGRKLGLWQGQVHMSADFNELPDELKGFFE